MKVMTIGINRIIQCHLELDFNWDPLLPIRTRKLGQETPMIIAQLAPIKPKTKNRLMTSLEIVNFDLIVSLTLINLAAKIYFTTSC